MDADPVPERHTFRPRITSAGALRFERNPGRPGSRKGRRCGPVGLGAVLLPCLLVAPAPAIPSAGHHPAAEDPGPGLRAMLERYDADIGALERKWDVPGSEAGRARLERLHREALEDLARLSFEERGVDARIDALLLATRARRSLARLDLERRRDAELRPWMPSAGELVSLLESDVRLEDVDPEQAAALLDRIAGELERFPQDHEHTEGPPPDPVVLRRAAARADALRAALEGWYRFRADYDPLFTWWLEAPHRRLSQALREHARSLREDLAQLDEERIVGDPIGREALLLELAFEWIPYEPAELVAIAEREYAWCERQMLAASRELGFGDDWKAALDAVKNDHVAPGGQPALIRDLAHESISFLESRELLSIPPLAKETWRMGMLSPERQRQSPYFLGGEVILVSFPTRGMDHADKVMSLRGNNRHFARATVHHELIPGHHLQGFMQARHRPWRSSYGTPFWTEGWAMYWEMVLWDEGFATSPQDRIGFLFWRMHRCARVLFSLSFHLGERSAEECVDFLVEKVGHERRNARAEVRRSVEGGYGPLYQCAYLVGALQLRALERELRASGRMDPRAFRDEVLRQNALPIELLRAALLEAPPALDAAPSWRFAD